MAPDATGCDAATQSYHPEGQHGVTSSAAHHPKRDPESMENTGVPGVSFYVPLTDPPPGATLPNTKVPKLFEPMTIRDLELKNRIIVSSMCMYSAPSGTGLPTTFHVVHQGQFAIRGVAMVFTEATAITPDGRISPEDLGIWSDDHIPAYARVVDFLHSQNCKAGIQLAHAGRKASTYAPWLFDGLISPPPKSVKTSVHVTKEHGGWDVRAPSAIPFSGTYPMPREMTQADFDEIKQAFVDAARRCYEAGYDVVELHAAHGYLFHQMLSPVSNQRTDKYGGSLENRMRWPLEVARAVRAAWPKEKPLFCRVSASDWHEDGEKNDQGEYISWGIEQTIIFTKELVKIGIDFMDVSSGGNYVKQQIKIGPGYQVHFAKALKDDPELKDLPIGTVGLITDAKQAEEILQKGEADAVLLAREMLRHADFAIDAAYELDAVVSVPVEYQRAHTRMFGKLKK